MGRMGLVGRVGQIDGTGGTVDLWGRASRGAINQHRCRSGGHVVGIPPRPSVHSPYFMGRVLVRALGGKRAGYGRMAARRDASPYR